MDDVIVTGRQRISSVDVIVGGLDKPTFQEQKVLVVVLTGQYLRLLPGHTMAFLD